MACRGPSDAVRRPVGVAVEERAAQPNSSAGVGRDLAGDPAGEGVEDWLADAVDVQARPMRTTATAGPQLTIR